LRALRKLGGRAPRRALGVLACLAAWLLVLTGSATAARPLETSVVDFGALDGPSAPLAFSRIRAAGSSSVRLSLYWRNVAPGAEALEKPAGFDSANPADPAYDWSYMDAEVRLAVANGLEPLITITSAPRWAEANQDWEPGTNKPDPVEFGRFAGAAAQRYSGHVPGLPRVRRWQAWNEQNHYRHLTPQYNVGINQQPLRPGAKLVSADHYRRMLNEFAAAVHAVHGDNLVVTGGLAPFHIHYEAGPAAGPLEFMRALLCLSRLNRPLPGCEPAQFDVWSHHPYTSGDPSHKAQSPIDVSLGDLPRMRRVLRAAIRAGHVASAGPVRFWVTEFSWDTQPPDRKAVPLRLHKRWVAEALYRMWRNGVSLVTWFQLRDEPNYGLPDRDTFQSGLYFRCASALRCDRPKPSLRAFRFPFVAFRDGRRVRVWGRTPGGRRGRVIVEQRSGGWKRLARLRADRSGIFARSLRTSSPGELRARFMGSRDTSAPFSLKRPPDRFVNPFGG
jgi:hypothetical protein